MRKRKVKCWNGRFHWKGKQGHCSIGAHSQKHAAELLGIALGGSRGLIGEIRNYFANVWGYAQKELVPEPEIGVWVKFEKPFNSPTIRFVDSQGRRLHR